PENPARGVVREHPLAHRPVRTDDASEVQMCWRYLREQAGGDGFDRLTAAVEGEAHAHDTVLRWTRVWLTRLTRGRRARRAEMQHHIARQLREVGPRIDAAQRRVQR